MKRVGISTQEQHSTWAAPMSRLRAPKSLFCFVLLHLGTPNSPKSISGISPGLPSSPQHKSLSLHFWCLDFTSSLQKQRRKENKKASPFQQHPDPSTLYLMAGQALAEGTSKFFVSSTQFCCVGRTVPTGVRDPLTSRLVWNRRNHLVLQY